MPLIVIAATNHGDTPEREAHYGAMYSGAPLRSADAARDCRRGDRVMLTRYGDAPQPARWSFGSILKVGLVARFSQIEGYRCLSLMRALGVVKCQFALVWLALRSCSQAAISSMRVCLSGMRRSRHWDDRTPSSDSARSSQLPCFGV